MGIINIRTFRSDQGLARTTLDLVKIFGQGVPPVVPSIGFKGRGVRAGSWRWSWRRGSLLGGRRWREATDKESGYFLGWFGRALWGWQVRGAWVRRVLRAGAWRGHVGVRTSAGGCCARVRRCLVPWEAGVRLRGRCGARRAVGVGPAGARGVGMGTWRLRGLRPGGGWRRRRRVRGRGGGADGARR